MKVIHVPDNYYIEKEKHEIEINHEKKYTENIPLKRKKGNLEITTKAGEATYEIYDDELNIIGTYETDEEGKVYIERINAGNCIIKQTKVKEGYKLVKDNVIQVPFNDTCYVTIVNEEEEKNQEEAEKPKEDEEDKKEEVVPPRKDDEVEEVVAPKEEGTEEKEPEQTPEEIEKPKEENTEKKPEEPKKEQKEEDIQEKTEKSDEETSDKEETPKEEKVQETIEKEETEEVQEIQAKMSTLPRTGNDYFIFKIILADLNIFLIIIFLSKLYSNKKKTRLSKEQVTKKI